MKTKLVLLAFLALTFLLLSGCDLDLMNRPTETPEPSLMPSPTETPMPTATETPTATPKPAWQQTIETQDLQDKFFQVIDGKPVIDLYDTQTQEEIVLNQESIKITTTTDGLNPNILTAKDADGNQYAFNQEHGWFNVQENNTVFGKLSTYIKVNEDLFTDGRFNLVQALNYANNPDKLPLGNDPILWVTAINSNSSNNILCLSYSPVNRSGAAERLWPEEYAKTWKNDFLSSGYKVNLPNGKYIYVLGSTVAIDKTRTISLANGFSSSRLEGLANNIYGSGRSGLEIEIEGIMAGTLDIVTILLPPEQLPDGTPVSFDQNHAALRVGDTTDVASLQGKRGELIASLGPANQQRILLALAENIRPDIPNDGKINIVTVPLSDPSQLIKLASHILLSDIASH